MSAIKLAIKHGQTLEVARQRLQLTVDELMKNYGIFVQRVEWAADCESVKVFGTGFELQMRVDAQEVHVAADIPLLQGFFGSPIVTELKAIFQKTFQKLLTRVPDTEVPARRASE